MAFVDRNIDDVTGMVTDIGFEDGKMLVRYTQDTQAAHERAQKMRDDDELKRIGIKKDLWRVVSLTDADCMKMIVEDGFDPYTAHPKEIKNFLLTHRDKWGHVFTTRGRF